MSEKNNQIIVINKDAKEICCPSKDAPIWNAHPRIYIKLDDNKPEHTCKYCSTKFVLEK